MLGYTELETDAIAAVKAIEKSDRETYYKNSGENHVHVGMPFSKGKPIIEKTELYRLIKEVCFDSIYVVFNIINMRITDAERRPAAWTC